MMACRASTTIDRDVCTLVDFGRVRERPEAWKRLCPLPTAIVTTFTSLEMLYTTRIRVHEALAAESTLWTQAMSEQRFVIAATRRLALAVALTRALTTTKEATVSSGDEERMLLMRSFVHPSAHFDCTASRRSCSRCVAICRGGDSCAAY